MISPQEFRERWDDESGLSTFPPDAMADAAIPDEARQFLMHGGLPESAAPFLGFAVPVDGPLPRASDGWGIGAEFARFREIGFNGSGDPICIDESTSHVVSLNHDNNFAVEFINSSVPQFAESLLAFRRLVQETIERNGEDAYLDGNIPTDVAEHCRNELQRIDSVALEDGTFWSQAFRDLGL